VSDIDCARVLADFNYASTLNKNGTNPSVNRDVAEISCQADESSKNSQMSVICSDACDNEESSCCDVESGMSSLVQDFKVEKSNLIPSACDQRTVGDDLESVVVDNTEYQLEDIEFGDRVERRRQEHEREIKAGKGCSIIGISSTNQQSEVEDAQELVESSDLQLQACDVVESNQLHVSESEGRVHIHVESNTLNSADSFNTFQYWRVPIPELQVNSSLADTGKPTAVHMKAKVTDENMQQTYASEVNADMDIDVSNLSFVIYLLGAFICAPFSVYIRSAIKCLALASN
jgi:hypothetical protein